MESCQGATDVFFATTDESLLPSDSNTVRVRRLPLATTGEIDTAALERAKPALPPPAAKVGPLAIARAHAEEPMALLLGCERYGAVADASATGATRPDGRRASSHVQGPPLKAAAEGGPKELPTMCDALREAAAQAGSRGVTFVAGGAATCDTYAELLTHARVVLAALRDKLGVRAGEAVALQLGEARVHLRCFWACALGAVQPVTVAVPNQYTRENATVGKLLGALHVLDAKHVLASSGGAAQLVALLPADVAVHDAASLGATARSASRAPPGAELDAPVGPDDVLFYQLTSGSTGTPKVIPETHAAVISHVRHSTAHCGYQPSDVTLNWLPFDHVVPMLTFHLCDVYLQRAGVQLPTAEVIAEPLKWIATMAAYRVTHSWAPNFGFKLVVAAARASGQAKLSYDVACIKYLMNAGEQVTGEACDAFAAVCGLAPRVLQPAFGMAECCTCMTYHNTYAPGRSIVKVLKSTLQQSVLAIDEAPAGAAAVAAHQPFVMLGGVSPGVEIRICSADGHVLNELQVGRFQIRGPCVMPGYHNHPKANAESILDDGWMDSGDLGFVYQGELVLTGRAKEMIILRGANYYCYEVEDVVAAVEGVTPARVAATSVRDEQEGTEQLLVFFVPSGMLGGAPTALLHEHGTLLAPLRQLVAAVRAQLAAALGLTARYVVPLGEAGFHVTTSGKIQRTAFQKAFLAGSYAVAARALDLGLSSSPLAAPDFFAAPTLVRKRTAEGASAATASVLWMAPVATHAAVKVAWSEQINREGGSLLSPSSYSSLALVDADDWAAASGALRDAGVTHFVHALMITSGGADDKASAAGAACASLCALAKALEALTSLGDGQLRVVCLRAPPADAAAQLAYATAGGALAPGVCKALSAEQRSVGSAALVDVPVGSSPTQLVGVVLSEVRGGSALDTEIAYRPPAPGAERGGGCLPSAPSETLHRFVKRFVNVGARLEADASDGDATSAAGVPLPLLVPSGDVASGDVASGGLVVVSGGLGAIGVAVVQLLLAELEGVGVLVLGRRSADAAAAAMRDHGWAGGDSRVAYAQLDLGRSEGEYSKLLDALRNALGADTRLVGVLHLAGSYERAPLAGLSADMLRAATSAKAVGAVHLHRACAALGASPSFVHFGSTATVFGGAGLGAYAGANAFLEWFAAWQRACGVRARTLVWTAWGTGISSRDKSLGFAKWVSPMPPRLGLAILRALLERSLAEATHPDVLIGVNLREPTLGALFADGLVNATTTCLFHAPDEVPTAAQCAPGVVVVGLPEWPRRDDASIDMDALTHRPLALLLGTAEVVAPAGPTEEGIAEVWSDVLGQPSGGMGRGMNFFDAGGTSILWMRAVSRLNARFDLKLAAMEIFEFAQLADLAAHIDALKASGGGQGWMPAACVELLGGEEGTASRAVFCLPSAMGTARSFSPLLARAPPPAGCVVFGVSCPSLVGKQDARMLPYEQWAGILAAAVTSKRAHGPYVLAAYGGAGAAACWACAEALAMGGAVVERIVLLDGVRPPWRMGLDAARFDKALPQSATSSSALTRGAAPAKQGTPVRWLSSLFGSSTESAQSEGVPVLSRKMSSKLSRRMSSGQIARRDSLAGAFEQFCARTDAVWAFAIELALERGWRGLPSYAAIEGHAGAEDPLDFVCRRAAKEISGIDVSHVRSVARCASDAQVRALTYSPAELPTTVRLVTAKRAGGGLPVVAEIYQPLARTVTETLVELGNQQATAKDDGLPDGVEWTKLPPTLRCMHDEAFLLAASRALFE